MYSHKRVVEALNRSFQDIRDNQTLMGNILPFQFKRLQFRLKLAFTITYNKSQDQTLEVAGIHLSTPLLTSHTVRFMTVARVASAQNLHVLADDNKSYKVIYRNTILN